MKRIISITSTLVCLLVSINLQAKKDQHILSYGSSDLSIATNKYSPTKPILSNKGITNTTVNLSWTASSDENEITGYKIYENNILKITLTNVLVYKITGLIPGTNYKYTVVAFNNLGEESTASEVLEITTTTTTTTTTRAHKFY